MLSGCTVVSQDNSGDHPPLGNTIPGDSIPGDILVNELRDPHQLYPPYEPRETDLVINRSEYLEKLYGFWLGQCIANWTGLVTEMDKVGNDR